MNNNDGNSDGNNYNKSNTNTNTNNNSNNNNNIDDIMTDETRVLSPTPHTSCILGPAFYAQYTRAHNAHYYVQCVM